MTELYNRPVGTIYETNDYSMFKRLVGNRRVDDSWAKVIGENMKEEGWIGGPILINQMMEVLDGGHRLNGAKEYNCPVRYTIIDGGLREVQKINNSKKWKMPEYIMSYIEQKNENYIRLYDVMKKYSASYTLVLRSANISTNDITKKMMMEGMLVFTEEHQKKADEKLPLIYDIMNAMSSIGFRGDKTPKEVASLFVVEHYDQSVVKKLCSAITRATPTYLSTMNTQALLDSFERIYNKGKCNNEKIYFGTDYKLKPQTKGVETRFKVNGQYNSRATTTRMALGL